MRILLYILSISFQVSGALLLMKYSLSSNREKVIKRFINKNMITKDYDGNIIYDKKELKETFKIAYLNKLSFLYITLGYLMNVFGKTDDSQLLFVIIGIVFFTLLFMILAYFSVYLIIKFSKNVNDVLTEKEMVKYKIDPNISTITKKEMNDIFKD